MEVQSESIITDSPWCTPVKKHERDSPPGATPNKVLRVGSHDGLARVPSEGVGPGEPPLTTTASTARTVATHIDGSPTFSPDTPGPSVEGIVKLLRAQQAQRDVVETVRLENARAMLARKSNGSVGDDRSDKASVSSKRVERREDRRCLPASPFLQDERYVYIRGPPMDLSLIHI